ncbi:TonB family protein [Steroidobacter cummioxidans]|uniref:TonB family protein n=1 Tax=Steroidobacter cummioxidans TaxID=1803913 RepID=UPI000E31B0B9|nr:TonB family protein [Steroidobacter cummioxidans]
MEEAETRQLTIRIKIVPQEASEVAEEPAQAPTSTSPRLSRSTLLLIAGAAAVVLSFVGIKAFRSDPTPPSVAAVVSAEPPAKPAVEAAVTQPAEPAAVRPPESDAPPSALNEVLPDVPQSALKTIRGTVRVSVRVTLDKQGTVVGAAAADRGPSRYFERLSVDAAKKWTFTPATLADRRTMLVKFNYTRDGATAEASALP